MAEQSASHGPLARALRGLLPKRARATASLLAEAMGRVQFEYADLATYRDDPAALRSFMAIVWLKQVESDRRKLRAAIERMNVEEGLPGLPAGHRFAIGCPPGHSYLYAEISATSAESASQIVHQFMRRALRDAALTIDWMRVEVLLDLDGDDQS